MAAKVIQSGERIILDPLLITYDDLEELENVIKTIDEKLKQSLKNEIEDGIEDLKNSVQEDKLARRIELLKGRKAYHNKKRLFRFTVKNGHDVDGNSISEIIKETDKLNFSPIELRIVIQHGTSNYFQLIIKSRDDEENEYKVKCYDDQEVQDDILGEMDKWLRKRKPKTERILRFWNHFGFLIAVLAGFATFFSGIASLPSDTQESYKSTLVKQAHSMINHGTSKDSLAKAVDLLLRLSSDYSPANYVPKTTHDDTRTAQRVLMCSIVLLIVGSIRPKTTIGIGKRKGLLVFYKYWQLSVFSIPGIFLLPPLYQWIVSQW